MALYAHGAEAATDVRGDGDAVAFLDVYYGRADFFDHAEGLMADDPAFDAAHAAFVKVEVSAADSSGRDAQQDVGGVLHLSVRNFAHRNLACLFKDDGFHRQLLSSKMKPAGSTSRHDSQVSVAITQVGSRQVAISSRGDPCASFNLIDFYHNFSRLLGVDSYGLTSRQVGEIAPSSVPVLKRGF